MVPLSFCNFGITKWSLTDIYLKYADDRPAFCRILLLFKDVLLILLNVLRKKIILLFDVNWYVNK